MLRVLVLVFALVNAGLWYWLQSDPQALQGDREPQRLGHQVAPDAIQVLPDLRAASAAQGAASAASAAVAASAVSMSASAIDVAKASEANFDCSETPPLDEAKFTALKAALAKAGVPAQAVAERRQPQGGAWIVYLGRFADSQTWQQKADELRKLDVKFERVNTPTTLAPGLSLGQFTSQADATKKLDELTKHGVHSARVVTLTAPTILRHLQVRASDPAWHRATGTQRFDSCPIEPPAKA
jgi:cell division septation protein DedD